MPGPWAAGCVIFASSGEVVMSSDESHEQAVSQPCTEGAARRSFLTKLTVVLTGLLGAMMVVPGLAFVLAPVFRKTPRLWRAVGKVDQFKVGSTVLVSYEDASPVAWAGLTATTGAWLRRIDEAQFIAFSINCRHLGCPVAVGRGCAIVHVSVPRRGLLRGWDSGGRSATEAVGATQRTRARWPGRNRDWPHAADHNERLAAPLAKRGPQMVD